MAEKKRYIAMFENQMDILADEFFDIVKRVFKDKIDVIVFDNIVDEPNHQTFKLDFKAYDYFTIEFDYENDLCEFFIVLTKEAKISLTKEPAIYNHPLAFKNLSGIRISISSITPLK